MASHVLQTGGRVDELVSALIEQANDTAPSVKTTVSKSLVDISKTQQDLVLSAICDYMIKTKPLVVEHKIALLNTIHKILRIRLEEASPDLCKRLVLKVAITELVLDKGMKKEWQQAASDVLVSLGLRFAENVINELLENFPIGKEPHYYVIKTLGDLAGANCYDLVPRLTDIFARVTPVLASLSTGSLKYIFAKSIGQFCDSILNYVANRPEGKYTPSSFSEGVKPAFEILFNNWLKSGEKEDVRLASLQALGSICACLSREQFEAELTRIVPTLLGFYKKEKNQEQQLPITQGLNSILLVAVKGGNRCLDPLVPSVLRDIHPPACLPPDYTKNISIKNYNELLRSFQTISIEFSDNVITFLLETLQKTKDIKIRKGTIGIIKHLVTHAAQQNADKKGLLVSGLKPIVETESTYEIRKEIAQTVISMASQGYLGLEGGEVYLDFIIRNASITEDEIAKWNKENSNKKKNEDLVSPQELRGICDNVLNLATTTISSMVPVLWPYLLETIVPSKYTEAIAIVCKCISAIASVKREREDADYMIDFDRSVNLPKPQAIICRLLVLLNDPLKRGSPGLHILHTLKALGPILHPSIYEMWDIAIPRMITFLETKSSPETWNKNAWEDLVSRLLSETINKANDDEWTNNLGEHLWKQIQSYDKEPHLKRVALKHFGVILQKSKHKEFIRTKLDAIFGIVNHNEEQERSGLAQGLGFCAATHLDMTLEKVQNSIKQKKEGGGFFSSLFSSGGDTTQTYGNTVVLAYGYIAAYADPSLIVSRMDVSIMNHLFQLMEKLKSIPSRETFVSSIDLIGKAVHPAHLEKEYLFKHRDDLIKQVLGYTCPKTDSKKIPLSMKNNTLKTLATLVLLQPVVPLDLEKQMMQQILPFYSIPPNDEDPAVQELVDNLGFVMGNGLKMSVSVSCLVRQLEYVEPLSASQSPFERTRALKAILYLLKQFLQMVKDHERTFNALGPRLAVLIPRCTDPVKEVRSLAIEAIQICLFIDRGKPGQTSLPEELLPFSEYRDRIPTSELNEQFGIISEMASALSTCLNQEELPQMLLHMMKGLTDAQSSSAGGTCVVINGLLKLRGKELAPKVAPMVSSLVGAMNGISHEQTMHGTLHAVRTLAQHHEIPVVEVLLENTVPHSTHVVKSLQAIAKDEDLVMPLVNHLLEILNTSHLHDEIPDPKNKEKTILVADKKACSATCALGEIMQVEEMEDVVQENYPLFLGTLLLRIGTSNGLADSTAAEQTAQTFRQFIECAKQNFLRTCMAKNDNWNRLRTPEYTVALAEIVAAMCKAHPIQMRPVYQFILPYLKGNFPGQRIAACCVLAEFVAHSKKDSKLLGQLINCLLTATFDPLIKLYGLRGMSNIVGVGIELANQYAPTVLDSLMTSIDDQRDEISLEAMNGLSKVFDIVEDSRIAPILINTCHRIKPAFDKENPLIRASAINLFGCLSRFGNSNITTDPFFEMMHEVLPALVLHIQDVDKEVGVASKGALQKLAKLFRAELISELLLEPRMTPTRQMEYGEFLNDLAKLLIQYFPERLNYYVMTCVAYFKSPWDEIKANAANFSGYMLGNLSLDDRKKTSLNPGLVTKALILLLREKSPDVRKASADAMSLLAHY